MDPKIVRRKIHNALALHPILTPSMLQIAVGTNVPPRIWRPVLIDMIAEGVVCRRDMEVQEVDYANEEAVQRSTFHSVLCLAAKGLIFEVFMDRPVVVAQNLPTGE